MKNGILMAITYIVILTVCLAASVAVVGGFVWLVCWAFGFTWSWKLSIGVWALISLAAAIFRSSGSKD